MPQERKATLTSPSQKLGVHYEDLVCAHLQEAGLRLLERNYLSRRGEIDIICLDRNTLVFVEVRYRRKQKHGHALETVNLRKQQKLIQTAKVYLQRKRLFGQITCRFDVVGVVMEDGKPVYHWIRNAFQ